MARSPKHAGGPDSLRYRPHPASASLVPRAARNNPKSHNLSTLAAHVCLRLPRAWYFSSTDLELTVNAVVLLRVLLQHVALVSYAPLSSADGSISPGSAAVAGPVYHCNLPPNPGATRNAELETCGFDRLLASCLDFTTQAPTTGEEGGLMLELHTQVATLVLVLLSTQLTHSDVLTTATLIRGVPPVHQLQDAPLAAMMALGRSTAPIAGAAAARSAGDKGKPAPAPAAAAAAAAPAPGAAAAAASGAGAAAAAPATRAQAFVGALLKHVCVDGARDEDAEPSPLEGSAASKASVLVATQRRKAVAGEPIPSAAPATAGATAAAASGAAAGTAAASTTARVATLASGAGGATAAGGGGIGSTVASAMTYGWLGPGGFLVSSLLGAAGRGGDPVPRPLAERCAALLLLLTHNLRSGPGLREDPALAAAVNPFRAALAGIADADRPASALPLVLPAAGADASTPGAAAAPSASGVRVSFKALFKALTSLCESPLGTCLLYTLMHTCPAFAEYVLT